MCCAHVRGRIRVHDLAIALADDNKSLNNFPLYSHADFIYVPLLMNKQSRYRDTPISTLLLFIIIVNVIIALVPGRCVFRINAWLFVAWGK